MGVSLLLMAVRYNPEPQTQASRNIHCSAATHTSIKRENIMQIEETRIEAPYLPLLRYTTCQNSMSDFVLG